MNSLSRWRRDNPDALGMRGRNVRVVGRAEVEVGLIGGQQYLAAASERRLSVPVYFLYFVMARPSQDVFLIPLIP